MRTPECKSVQMALNRQQDVHEFFVKVMEHFEKDSRLTADTYGLLGILNIKLRSTTAYQQCSHSYTKDDYLWVLSLYFQSAVDEDISIKLDISYLMDKYFQTEIIPQATCSQCHVVGQTVKTLNIINAPQVLVIHLARFHAGLDKIDSFVEFHTTHYITDENGQQVTYRLTGLILHTGISIAAGHYLSYFLVDEMWVQGNDKEMKDVS